jgi:PEP-CTERM motif
MRSMKSYVSMAGLAFIGSMALSVHADTLIVGYPAPPPVDQGYFLVPAGLPPNQAVQFTLTNGFDVSQISVGLMDARQGDGTAPATTFDFTLQDRLTNPASVFFSGSVLLPALGASQNQLLATYTMNVNSFIGAGTYYLVALAEAGGSKSDGWLVSDGVEVSNGGTGPNIAFFTDANGVWQSGPGQVTVYSVFGSPVPEPSSLILLSTGMLCLIGATRRVAKRYRDEFLVTG